MSLNQIAFETVKVLPLPVIDILATHVSAADGHLIRTLDGLFKIYIYTMALSPPYRNHATK